MKVLLFLPIIAVMLVAGCIQDDNQIYQQATNNLNPDACDSIVDDRIRWDCYNNIAGKTKDISVCEEKNTTGSCDISVAVTTQDLSICDSLESKIIYIDIAECYRQVAVKNNNLTICGMIENKVYEWYCYKDIAYIRNDSSICEMAYWSDRCLEDLEKQIAANVTGRLMP